MTLITRRENSKFLLLRYGVREERRKKKAVSDLGSCRFRALSVGVTFIPVKRPRDNSCTTINAEFELSKKDTSDGMVDSEAS